MDAGTLEEIQQEYELSIINVKETERIVNEKRELLSQLDTQYQQAKAMLTVARETIAKNRKKYEDALYEYEYWGENNE